MSSPSESDYLIALYISGGIFLLVLLLLTVVLCLRYKHKRLNWYERSLLEESDQKRHDERRSDTDVKHARFSEKPATDIEAETGARERQPQRGNKKGWWRLPLNSIVELVKTLKEKFSTGLRVSLEKNSIDSERKTEWINCSRKKMGSTPSSPVNESMDKEKFWVPPAVLDRKRAQSLVPTVHHNDSEEEASSGTTTPASLSGLAYTYPSVPLISTDGLPSPIPPGNRQRRASMQDAIDFRKIDSKLYDRRLLQRQHSVASIEEEHLGSINFSLAYNEETHLLTVHLIEAENLASRDFSGTADPYCKICLLPNRRTQLQSKIHRKTTQPLFDEEFIFEVEPMDLPTLTLEVLLFDYDQYSRHECIGQTKLSFGNVDFDQKQVYWKPISPVDPQKSKEAECGDVIFSLGYLSSAERLTIVVMKARNLRHVEEGKITMDPYVKVCVNTGGKKIKKKKTSTKHNVFNPVWNEALTFSLSNEHLQNLSLEFIVYHDNKMGNDEILGRVKISQDTDGDERLHWDEMVGCRSAVARWHNLT